MAALVDDSERTLTRPGGTVSLTEAKRPIVWVIATSPCLDPIDVAVVDPHTVPRPQVEVARSFDDQRAA